MSSFETIKLEQEGPVARITIDREAVLNALSSQVLNELHRAVDSLDASTRVVVFAGAGAKAFVAGADISEMAEMSPDQARAFSRLGQHLTEKIEALHAVTIARVQGFALGGGCELAMAADMIVASTKAKFGQPEVGLGLVAGFGGTQRLVERVGQAVAMDMLCASRNLTGEEAATLGLVARVAEPDELDAAVNLCIKSILKAGPQAIAATKSLVRRARESSLSAGLSAEADAFAGCFGREEGLEGAKAFLEKRKAAFSH